MLDGRIALDTNKEIVNLESDKIDSPIPDKVIDYEEINSKKTDVNLPAPSSAKKGNSNNQSPVSQQNRFSLLEEENRETVHQNTPQPHLQQINHTSSFPFVPGNAQFSVNPIHNSVLSPVLTPVLTPVHNSVKPPTMAPVWAYGPTVDEVSKCNSSSIEVNKKARVHPSSCQPPLKARVLPSSSQPPLKVRKKLSDIITDLHQLVAPFGKELDDPLTIIYEKKISSINAIVEVLELALKAYFTFFTPFFIYCIESVSQSSKSVSILQGAC
ncbi:hypothetical protein P8452_47584 [Trifolium repens]|nr:hypothetical protein P8452_47584 [Trifolium repens]